MDNRSEFIKFLQDEAGDNEFKQRVNVGLLQLYDQKQITFDKEAGTVTLLQS